VAFDDPIIWVLIVVAVVLLFGAGKIPQLAKSLGQARREFDNASKGIANVSVQAPAQPTPSKSPAEIDPLVTAAKNEGIDTQGKTKEQIAAELAWKLNRK